MVSIKHIKILHIMIFIGVMGFSVRLIDVAQGVAGFMNTAQAEAGEVSGVQPPSQSELNDPEEGMELAQADIPESPEAETESDEAENEGAEPGEDTGAEEPNEEIADELIFEDDTDEKWRDATDGDITYSNIRMELFEDLTERRQEIERKERALSTREAMLRAAEKELDQKYQELDQLRAEIETLLEKQSEEEQGRLASLVKIYEGMKAKEAARIFDTLDLDVLVSVMSQMSERKLSGILAAMNPERARTVTILLAEEKQLPSLPDNN